MKKNIALVLLFFVVQNINAQKLSIEPTIGVHYSRAQHMDAIVGWQAGAKVHYFLSDKVNRIYLSSGMLFNQKGWKESIYFDDQDKTIEWKVTPTYLEIPLHIGYKYAPENNTTFFCDLGPYFAVGIFGKSEIKTTEYLPEKSGNVFSDGLYKRFDIGLSGSVGVGINHWQLGLNISKGLENQAKGSIKAMSLKDFSYGVSLGYQF